MLQQAKREPWRLQSVRSSALACAPFALLCFCSILICHHSLGHGPCAQFKFSSWDHVKQVVRELKDDNFDWD